LHAARAAAGDGQDAPDSRAYEVYRLPACRRSDLRPSEDGPAERPSAACGRARLRAPANGGDDGVRGTDSGGYGTDSAHPPQPIGFTCDYEVGLGSLLE